MNTGVRFKARLLALLAALLVVLPAGALPATYYCRWMGETMSSCCCRGHDDKAQAKGPSEDKLKRANCCELVKSSDSARPVTREAPIKVDAAAIVARIQVEVVVVPESRDVPSAPAQARAHPGVGPPLFLSHCSLLI
jgi:hypothetical protein